MGHVGWYENLQMPVACLLWYYLIWLSWVTVDVYNHPVREITDDPWDDNSMWCVHIKWLIMKILSAGVVCVLAFTLDNACFAMCDE